MKIKTVLILYILCISVNACIKDETYEGDNLNMALFTYSQTGSNYCNDITGGGVECCTYTASGNNGLSNYTAVYGTNHVLFAPPEFNITMVVQPHTRNAAYETSVGLGNYTGNSYKSGIAQYPYNNGLIDVSFANGYTNGVGVFCGDNLVDGNCVNCAYANENITVEFLKTLGSTNIEVRVNGTNLANCTISNENSVYVPYFSEYYGASSATDICSKLYSVYIKSNYTVSNTLNFMLDDYPINSIANCTAEFSPYFGQYPYFTSDILSTDTNPTGLNRFYPSCNNFIGSEIWLSTGFIDGHCRLNYPPYTDYNTAGGIVYSTGSVNKNMAINLTMFGENVTLCDFEVIVINESQNYITNAIVKALIYEDDITANVFLTSYGNGSYLLKNQKCNSYVDLSVEAAPKYPYNEYPRVAIYAGKMTIELKANQLNYNFNVRLNATNYGTISPDNIKAHITSAYSSEDCQNQNGISFYGYPYKKYLDSNGDTYWGNLVTDRQWICAYLIYEDTSKNCNKVDSKPYVLGQMDYNFTISCGITDGTKNRYTWQFLDDKTNTAISNVSFTIKNNGNTLYQETSDNDGNFIFNESCNSDKLVYTYATDLNGYVNANFYPVINEISYSSCLDVSVKRIRLTPLAETPNATNTFYLDGYLVENTSYGLIDDVNVLLKCDGHETETYLNTDGSYNFTNIIAGSRCYLTVNNLGWRGESTRISINKAINRNLTIYQVVLNPNVEIIQPYYTYLKQTGGNKPIDGVLVYISSGKQCTTQNGKCSISLNYGVIYQITATKEGLLTTKINDKALGEDTPIIMESPSGADCTLEIQLNKLVDNATSGIDGKITLTDSDGYIKSETMTENNGYLKLSVDCGNQYSIIGDINGYKVRKSIVTEEGEGHSQKISLDFDISDVGFMEELKAYKKFVYSLFFFAFIITLGFLLLICVMIYRAIVHGETYKRGGRYGT